MNPVSEYAALMVEFLDAEERDDRDEMARIESLLDDARVDAGEYLFWGEYQQK